MPALYRVHERPEPRGGRAAGRPARVARRRRRRRCPEPHDAAAGGRDRRRGVAARRPRTCARTGHGAPALTVARAALAQAGPLLRRATSATPACARRATATSPRRSAATRTWSATARCSARWAAASRRRAPSGSRRRASGCSAREREAMTIERDADDVARCFLLERELFEGGCEHGLRGRGRRPDRRRARSSRSATGYEGMLPVRRLRGDWWELNEQGTILVGTPQRRRDPPRRPGHASACARIDAPRGRVDLDARPTRVERTVRWPRAARRKVGAGRRRDQPPGVVPLQPARAVRVRASC